MTGHLTVELHALWTGASRGYRYNVTMNGECIVGRSHDPETDLARALLARGHEGTVTVLDGKTGKPRTCVNIDKTACLRTVETGCAPRFRKQTRAGEGYAGQSALSGSEIATSLPGFVRTVSFPQKKIQEAAVMTRLPSSLYPDEEELARCVLGKKAKQWAGLAPTLEREGLPRIDPLAGGRYWPAVRAFLDRRHGLRKDQVPASADGEETW